VLNQDEKEKLSTEARPQHMRQLRLRHKNFQQFVKRSTPDFYRDFLLS